MQWNRERSSNWATYKYPYTSTSEHQSQNKLIRFRYNRIDTTFFSLKKEKAYTCKLKKRESKSKGSKVSKIFEADKKNGIRCLCAFTGWCQDLEGDKEGFFFFAFFLWLEKTLIMIIIKTSFRPLLVSDIRDIMIKVGKSKRLERL